MASVFAYAHLIGWAVLVNRGVGPRAPRPIQDLTLDRSIGWLVTGALIVFVAVLGPGFGPLEDDPRLDSS